MSQPIVTAAGSPVTTATGGTALTSTQVANLLTRPLEAASYFLASGPRIFDSAGPLRLPSAPVENTTLAFTGDAELIPEETPTFGEVTLLPSTMKSVKVITRYSNELARQSVVALEAALRDRLVRDVANKIDRAAFGNAGDGTTEPMGLFKWANTAADVAVGGKLTVDKLLAAQGTLLAENVDPNSLRVFIRPEDYTNLRSEKATADGRYQLQPDATKGGVGTVLGMGVTVTSHIPVGFGAVCDMSQVAVARDLAPSVMVLTERYADYDEQAIRVVARYDWKPINPKGIVKLTGITK